MGKGRRPVNMLTYKGHTRSLVEWAAIIGIRTSTLKERIDRGWALDDLFLPSTRPSVTSQQSTLPYGIQNMNEIINNARVDRAITKVLRMRETRSLRIENDLNHQEEVNCAIAKVLMMRARRSRRLSIAA